VPTTLPMGVEDACQPSRERGQHSGVHVYAVRVAGRPTLAAPGVRRFSGGSGRLYRDPMIPAPQDRPASVVAKSPNRFPWVAVSGSTERSISMIREPSGTSPKALIRTRYCRSSHQSVLAWADGRARREQGELENVHTTLL
jgi:hypothetical protein